MGLLDGIGLLVVILLAIAGCSYCYSRCCHRSGTQRNPRSRRHRRQKNARRKRRRQQRNNSSQSRPPPSSQCNVDIYPDQPPQGLMFPQQFPSQVHAPPPQYQHFPAYQPLPAVNYPPVGQIPQAGHTMYGQLPPPPYDFHQPQGQPQNCTQPDTSFFAQGQLQSCSQSDTSFFAQGQHQNCSQPENSFYAQSPPPPYDTQFRPQSQQSRQFDHGDQKC